MQPSLLLKPSCKGLNNSCLCSISMSHMQLPAYLYDPPQHAWLVHTLGVQDADSITHSGRACCDAAGGHPSQEGVPVDHGHQHREGRLQVTA